LDENFVHPIHWKSDLDENFIFIHWKSDLDENFILLTHKNSNLLILEITILNLKFQRLK